MMMLRYWLGLGLVKRTGISCRSSLSCSVSKVMIRIVSLTKLLMTTSKQLKTAVSSTSSQMGELKNAGEIVKFALDVLKKGRLLRTRSILMILMLRKNLSRRNLYTLTTKTTT
jgi:hypothetical protein